MPYTRTQHILVVTNETAAGEELHQAVASFALDPAARVHVVAPALNSRLRHWFSDTDSARLAAQSRLDECVAQLRALGLDDVDGHVGDEDPMHAIADALATFPATELVISTHPEARSNWLAYDLVNRAVSHFGLPTMHVVVDVAATSGRRAAVAA